MSERFVLNEYFRNDYYPTSYSSTLTIENIKKPKDIYNVDDRLKAIILSIDNDNNWILGATGFSSTGFACICVSLMPESGLVLFGNGNTIQILYSDVTNITDNLIES